MFCTWVYRYFVLGINACYASDPYPARIVDAYYMIGDDINGKVITGDENVFYLGASEEWGNQLLPCLIKKVAVLIQSQTMQLVNMNKPFPEGREFTKKADKSLAYMLQNK